MQRSRGGSAVKVCKSCEAVVPEHLDACPHCRCDGAWCLQKRVMALSTVAMLGLTGCPEEDTGPGPEPEYGVALIDVDQDGSPEGEDCDDDDATVHPGATETPGDTIDSNCDGEDDT